MNSGPLIDCEVTNFIRGANPIWSLVDLDGKQMDDTFWLYVLENEIPYIPATVFHDPSGTIPWTNPIQFLANGTLPIDIYFANHTIYRLEIRHNLGILPPSQADPLIYLIEDYNPSQSVDIPTNTEGDSTENQISNAQFSVVNFHAPQTYTNLTGSVEIAPGWFLDLVGIGTVTVDQIPLNNALSNPTNAPYALRLTIGGPYAQAPVLRQRFQQNGQNWANKTVSSSFTGLITGAAQVVSLRLDASNGAMLALLQTQTLSNVFGEYEGFATLGASPNPDLPPNAYIDFKFILPTSGDVYLTSFQLVISDNQINVPYQEDTIDRQLDHLFHYYKPKLEAKPIPSYLTGWDFNLNPAQILGDTVGPSAVGANKSFYAWDQTIIFQELNNGVVVTRNATTGGITLTANGGNGRFAMLQYLDASQIKQLLSGKMAVYLKGFTNLNAYDGTITLWGSADPTLPDLKTPNFNSAVSALTGNGRPTMANGTWVEIPRSNFGDAAFQLNAISSEHTFWGWDPSGLAIATTANWFAIVVGFETVVATEAITIPAIGLYSGDIATKPAPKTQDEVVLNCQRYYFSTFPLRTAPINNFGVNTGCLDWQYSTTGTGVLYNMRYPVTMRATPILTIYNPAAANSLIRNLSVPTDLAGSAATANSTARAGTIGAPNSGASAGGNELQAHITSDARLGIVL